MRWVMHTKRRRRFAVTRNHIFAENSSWGDVTPFILFSFGQTDKQTRASYRMLASRFLANAHRAAPNAHERIRSRNDLFIFGLRVMRIFVSSTSRTQLNMTRWVWTSCSNVMADRSLSLPFTMSRWYASARMHLSQMHLLWCLTFIRPTNKTYKNTNFVWTFYALPFSVWPMAVIGNEMADTVSDEGMPVSILRNYPLIGCYDERNIIFGRFERGWMPSHLWIAITQFRLWRITSAGRAMRVNGHETK